MIRKVYVNNFTLAYFMLADIVQEQQKRKPTILCRCLTFSF